ncbi:MAG: KTSC domain-containing protein [Patescibacteria group bacterium]|nr:KTSC domain-containing protein [Patescibacteria group bacterium]
MSKIRSIPVHAHASAYRGGSVYRSLGDILGSGTEDADVERILKYATAGAGGSTLPRWLTALLDAFIAGRSVPQSRQRVTRELMDFLGTLGKEIERARPQSQSPRTRSSGGLVPPSPPSAPPSPPTPPPSPEGFRPIPGRGRGVQQIPPRPGEEQANPFSREILTPQSSNVFSFSYDYQISTLYVTYKAPELHAGVRSVGQRGQLHGLRGKTISGKTNQRGAMYAYLDVPARVFDRMQLAVSKGKFVWDELRVRGTVYGAKYRYMLVQGAVIAKAGGVYIPRKATKRGFVSRANTVIGAGRRGFVGSTIAPRMFKGPRYRPMGGRT